MQDSQIQTELPKEFSPAIDLEKLLQAPQKKSPDWQASAARLTAIVHNYSLGNESDDLLYLRSLALCRWAQTVGVLEAKKKNIQAIRFRTAVPPSLDLLENPELINAGIELLVSLRGEWCKDYITSELKSLHHRKKGLANLLKWAQKTAVSTTDFFEMVLSNITDSTTDEKHALLLIKDASSKINFDDVRSPKMAAANLFNSVQFLTQLLEVKTTKKIELALISLLNTTMSKARMSHPTIVLQSSFLLAVQNIQNRLVATTYKKTAQAMALTCIAPTLSVLIDLCATGGQDGISYSKLLLPTLRNTYADFDKKFNEAANSNTDLQQLKGLGFEQDQSGLEDTATSIYARLLPAWFDFYRSNKDLRQLSLLNDGLLEAAKINGIEFMGSTGEELSFDPVAHRLQNDGETLDGNVRIISPAVIFRRTNNTYRIVLPAIVSPV